MHSESQPYYSGRTLYQGIRSLPEDLQKAVEPRFDVLEFVFEGIEEVFSTFESGTADIEEFRNTLAYLRSMLGTSHLWG